MGVVRRPLVGQRSGTQCRCLRYQACNLEQGTFDKNRIIGDKKYSRYRSKVIADISGNKSILKNDNTDISRDCNWC